MIKTVNMTSFTVDYKLKEFIHYIKTHNDVFSLLFNTRYFIDILNNQQHLREMFVEKLYDGMRSIYTAHTRDIAMDTTICNRRYLLS